MVQITAMVAAAILVVIGGLICLQPQFHVAYAYSPSIGVSRCHPRGALSMPWQEKHQNGKHCQSRSSLLLRQNTHLFYSNSDVVQATSSNETIRVDLFSPDAVPSQGYNNSKVLDGHYRAADDNLLPSTMTFTRNSRTVGSSRRYSGLPSSSSMIGPDQSQQAKPLIQSSSQTSEYNTPTKSASWKERLVDVSNLASLLCVLDCTLLPLVSIAIPALSWGVGLITGAGALGTTAMSATGSSSIMAGLSSVLAYLPALSHGIALYFVIPVGVLTTIVNYFFGHREVRFSLLSFVGVALIYAANSSVGIGIPSVDIWLRSMGIVASHTHHAGHIHDACGAIVGATTGMMTHSCAGGLAHRVTNTLGCAFLLGSNYLSRKYVERRSQGCAASALAKAWGGLNGGRVVCPPGCNCGAPTYGRSSSSSTRMGGETFFQWERMPRDEREIKKGGVLSRLIDYFIKG